MAELRPVALHLYAVLARFLPPTRAFGLKRTLLRLAGARVQEDVRLVSSASFYLGGRLSIGKGTFVGHEVLVVGGDAHVSIGVNCDIGPRVLLVTGSHEILGNSARSAGDGYSLPIMIGEGCWIGAGATILGGTVIGDHSVIAAGAVVKGEFPGNSLVGGVPARVLRRIDTDSTIRASASGETIV